MIMEPTDPKPVPESRGTEQHPGCTCQALRRLPDIGRRTQVTWDTERECFLADAGSGKPMPATAGVVRDAWLHRAWDFHDEAREIACAHWGNRHTPDVPRRAQSTTVHALMDALYTVTAYLATYTGNGAQGREGALVDERDAAGATLADAVDHARELVATMQARYPMASDARWERATPDCQVNLACAGATLAEIAAGNLIDESAEQFAERCVTVAQRALRDEGGA